MKRLTVIPFALALTACATSPRDIEHTRVDHRQYLALSCDELDARIKETDADYRDHVDGQETQRKFDILLFPGFSRVIGQNQRNVDAISTLGGELDAMQRAKGAKDCP